MLNQSDSQLIRRQLIRKKHKLEVKPDNYPNSVLQGKCWSSAEPNKPCITAVSDKRKGGKPAGY